MAELFDFDGLKPEPRFLEARRDFCKMRAVSHKYGNGLVWIFRARGLHEMGNELRFRFAVRSKHGMKRYRFTRCGMHGVGSDKRHRAAGKIFLIGKHGCESPVHPIYNALL